jgi:BASS family bile acid:Na+ symporter
MSLTTLIPLILKLSIMLSVFAIGLNATFADTLYLFRRPAKLLRAFVSMNIIMPVFALLLAYTFQLHLAVKIALVALSVSPIPPILPRKALKSGGRENYTIGLLTASAVISVVAIPVTMEVVERIFGIPLQMRAREVAWLMLSSVLIPLLLGMGVRYLWTSFAERAAKPIAVVSLVVLIVACLPILFTSVRSILILVGDGTLLALAAFALVGVVTGHLLGGPDPEDRPVLALATCSRHPAVALAIGHANFPGQKLAGALVLVYLVLSAILVAPYLNWTKKSHSTTATTEKQVEA